MKIERFALFPKIATSAATPPAIADAAAASIVHAAKGGEKNLALKDVIRMRRSVVRKMRAVRDGA
jgi:hypothetical protein